MNKVMIGKWNDLKVGKEVDFGLYLEGDGHYKEILLPKKNIPEGTLVGDRISVFIYKDSSDRIIATTKHPYAQADEMAYLKVIEGSKIGYFLDIGLERDVLLPFSQIPYTIHEGQHYLVRIYVDKTQRLCATAKIEEYLRADSPYQKGDIVTGIVYKTHTDIGTFIAVEKQYYGLIPKTENFRRLQIGEELSLRVIRVREDGKLDVSPNKLAHEQMVLDGEIILQQLEMNEGFIPLHDRSEPEAIKKQFKISKAAFKRAVGGLMKENKIHQDEKGIHLIENKNNSM